MLRRLTNVLFFLFLYTCSTAQFNIKVGYSGMYISQPGLNSIFQNYNTAHPNLSEEFSNIRFLHGIEVGVRYKISHDTGLELTWNNHQSTSNKANGLDANSIFFEESWKVNSSEYSVGLENYYGNFGFGITLGSRSFKYASKVPGSSKKVNIYSDNVLNSRICLILHVKSGNTGFALKPYYQIPWGDLNLRAVDLKLNGTNLDVIEDYKAFGISLIFYNGPQ